MESVGGKLTGPCYEIDVRVTSWIRMGGTNQTKIIAKIGRRHTNTNLEKMTKFDLSYLIGKREPIKGNYFGFTNMRSWRPSIDIADHLSLYRIEPVFQLNTKTRVPCRRAVCKIHPTSFSGSAWRYFERSFSFDNTGFVWQSTGRFAQKNIQRCPQGQSKFILMKNRL